MGHVDHAHDAEGDRQPDRRQQQDRAESQTEEQIFHQAVEQDTRLDTVQRLLRGGTQLRILVAARQPGKGVAGPDFQRAAQRLDRAQTNIPVGALELGERYGGVDGALDQAGLFYLLALLQQVDAVTVDTVANEAAHRLVPRLWLGVL